jgi:hypothetical protein
MLRRAMDDQQGVHYSQWANLQNSEFGANPLSGLCIDQRTQTSSFLTSRLGIKGVA